MNGFAAFNKVSREKYTQKKRKIMIKHFGHVSGTIWISILWLRPFPPFSLPFPPLSVLNIFCLFWLLLFFSWWRILLYLLFTYYTSIAFWKHAANAVTNNSTKTAFCGAMTVSQTCRNPIPPVSGDVALLRFGISFEIKQVPLLFTNPKTEKNQKTKTTKKPLRPQHQNPKMPRISWTGPTDPPRRFFKVQLAQWRETPDGF